MLVPDLEVVANKFVSDFMDENGRLPTHEEQQDFVNEWMDDQVKVCLTCLGVKNDR